MKKLVPILSLIAGIGAGAGAGLFLAPGAKNVGYNTKNQDGNSEPSEKVVEKTKQKYSTGHGKEGENPSSLEYLKLTKQFVVPVVDENEISALVTLSLSLETRPGISEDFYQIEPKLRDGFLQVLFDHANIGGFDGEFTRSDNLAVLRKSLLEVAQKDLGDDVSRVLIMSVSRQDT